MTAQLIVYISAQWFYTLLIVLLRPFAAVKDNILEIMNEFFYIGFCVTLFWYNSENDWSSTSAWVYIGFMMGNNGIIAIISFCEFLSLKRLEWGKYLVRFLYAFIAWLECIVFLGLEIYKKWRKKPKTEIKPKNQTLALKVTRKLESYNILFLDIS